MSWYAAHCIVFTKFKEGPQESFPIFENIYLIEAATPDEALEKASTRGKEEEGDASGTYTYDDRPATLVFGGVRKMIECEDPEDRPKDGTEITYSRMEVADEDSLDKLVSGEPVTVLYEE